MLPWFNTAYSCPGGGGGRGGVEHERIERVGMMRGRVGREGGRDVREAERDGEREGGMRQGRVDVMRGRVAGMVSVRIGREDMMRGRVAGMVSVGEDVMQGKVDGWAGREEGHCMD